MIRRLLILVLATTTGCLRVYRAANDIEDPDAAYVRRAAGPLLGCQPGDVKAAKDGETDGFEWTATGCSKTAVCNGSWSKWSCRLLPLPFWYGTDDELPVALATERLELETGCANDAIEATKGTLVTGLRGSTKDSEERAYRMKACGKAFVCAVRLPAAVECRAALGEVAAELVPDAGAQLP